MTDRAPTLPAAGLARRLAAIGYDSLLVAAIWFVIGGMGLALSGGALSRPDRPVWLLLAFRAVLVASLWLFFAWFWTHGGQTLGMRAWRLQLVNENGGPVRWKQTLWRFAGACLSAGALGLGYLWVLFDRERLSWHDRLSATRLRVLPKKA